jgi:hypothetical protein
MKSQMMWTVTCRRLASVVMASIWVAMPSTGATQVRRWTGSRRRALSRTAGPIPFRAGYDTIMTAGGPTG